jgi:dCTP deaminase
MTIKSDKWIRRMAEQHGMIEPFEPNQVKEVNGQKIVSYGTSSYGYDIRCSREFKVFTNINSTIVDPQELRSQIFRRTSRPMSASSRRIPLRWRVPSNISASRARC